MRNGVFALSQGERVSRDRRFHQPVSRRGQVKGFLREHNNYQPTIARPGTHAEPKEIRA